MERDQREQILPFKVDPFFGKEAKNGVDRVASPGSVNYPQPSKC